MAGEPTEVQDTPIGFVKTEVVSNDCHNSFDELYDDAQRVTSEGPEIEIDLDFPNDPSDHPSYHTGNGNESPSGSPSDEGGQDPPSGAEERADRLALAALMKERERAQLKSSSTSSERRKPTDS